MSEQAMVELAKSVVREPGYQKHVESLPDERLAQLGLEPEEIGAIRDGFLDRVLRLGMVLDDAQGPGCCI